MGFASKSSLATLLIGISALLVSPSISFAKTHCAGDICVGDRIVPQAGWGGDCLPEKIPSGCQTATIVDISEGVRGDLFRASTSTTATIRCASGQALTTRCFGPPDIALLAQGCTPEDKMPWGPSRPKVCVGDSVTNASGTFAVLGIKNSFVRNKSYFDLNDASALFVKGENGEKVQMSYAGWYEKGCLMGLCVGDDVVNLEGHACRGTIDGLGLLGTDVDEASGKTVTYPNFHIRFTEGDNVHTAYTNIRELAQTKGCLNDICVGQKVVTTKNRQAEVAGIRIVKATDGGNFVLKFSDNGDFGHGWRKSDFKPAP